MWLNEVQSTEDGLEWSQATELSNGGSFFLSLKQVALVTHLYSWGVHPVGNVTRRHIHWQDDGLTVVIQARGGTLWPWEEAQGKVMAKPYLQTPVANMPRAETAFCNSIFPTFNTSSSHIVNLFTTWHFDA